MYGEVLPSEEARLIWNREIQETEREAEQKSRMVMRRRAIKMAGIKYSNKLNKNQSHHSTLSIIEIWLGEGKAIDDVTHSFIVYISLMRNELRNAPIA